MLVAGLMSGTSADAVEIAVVDVRGKGLEPRVRFVGAHSVPYSGDVRQRILAVAGGNPTTAQEISQLNFLLGELFARAFLDGCKRLRIDKSSVRLIGSHGQTIHHQPLSRIECGIPIRSTLQIGELSIIANRTGIPTIGDFRPADMAAGGQGAPLVPYFDYLMYRHRNRGRIVLNLGGIANLTFIPASARSVDIRAFDTGPGNMVLDQLASVATKGRQGFDADGRLASQGSIDELLVKRILQMSYFRRRPPKSTGRELFGGSFVRRWFNVHTASSSRRKVDALATATALTAASIAEAIRCFVIPIGIAHDCLVSGGGVKNPVLMEQLRRRLETLGPGGRPLRVINLTESRVPAAAKEAVAFAVLAYQTYRRQPSNIPAATGATRPVVLGKLIEVC